MIIMFIMFVIQYRRRIALFKSLSWCKDTNTGQRKTTDLALSLHGLLLTTKMGTAAICCDWTLHKAGVDGGLASPLPLPTLLLPPSLPFPASIGPFPLTSPALRIIRANYAFSPSPPLWSPGLAD